MSEDTHENNVSGPGPRISQLMCLLHSANFLNVEKGLMYFIKVVWADSEKVGCASKQCSSVEGFYTGMSGEYTLVACNYSPA